MDLPYSLNIVSARANLFPSQLDNNIDTHLSHTIKQKLEKRCTKDGYVRPGSVVIVSRSLGLVRGCHFNGQITFDVECVADICRPHKGDQFVCTIQNINKMGLLAKAGDDGELHVYVVIQHHNNAAFFDDPRMKEHTRILVEVVGVKAKMNDTRVVVIAKMVKIYDEDELDDYAGKKMKLQAAAGLETITWDPEVSESPAEPKPYLGFESYSSTTKSLLSNLRPADRDALQACLETGNCHETAISAAVCMASEFELIWPDSAYDPTAETVRHAATDRSFFELHEILHDFQLLSNHTKDMLTLHVDSSGAHADSVKTFVGEKKLQSLLISNKETEVNDLPGQRTLSGVINAEGTLTKTGLDEALLAVAEFPQPPQLFTSKLGLASEDKSATLLFTHFYLAAATLGNKGCAVFEVNDIFTKLTAKLVYIAASCFEEAHLVKPFAVRDAVSTKYLVCKGFNGLNKQNLQDIRSSYEAWQTAVATNLHIRDIGDFRLPQSAVDVLQQFNYANVTQRQVRALSQTVGYIKSSDMEEEVVQTRKASQAVLARAWYRRYFDRSSVVEEPPKKTLHVNKAKLSTRK